MLGFPVSALYCQHNTGAVGVTSLGTSVTTGASSATKGTAVELISSTSFDAYWITVCANNYGASGVASGGCLDILLGAATEHVLIPNLLMGGCGLISQGSKFWHFPLYIPKGSRIAAQAAGERTSTAMNVAVWLYGGGLPILSPGTRVTTYGIGTVPNGTAITPGASGAEGSWTEITSGTSRRHRYLVPSFQLLGDSAMSARGLEVDVGIGSATEALLREYHFTTNSTETIHGPIGDAMPIAGDFPASSRLAMRASNSGTNNTGYQGAIHAVD